MKIAVCGSMVFSPEMLELSKKLQRSGHEVILPEFTTKYAQMKSQSKRKKESAHNKVQYDLIRGYFHKIQECDAVLIYNQNKEGVPNYIGGNTFLEIGFAHVLKKRIFLYKPVPNMHYRNEIEAMQPIILNSDLERIVG